MVDNNATSVQNALQGGGIQFAMPQSVLSVPKTSHQVQKVMYDQAKLQALKDALALKRPTMSRWEAFANSLANLETPQSRIGGFGEEIINPWADAITSFARGFGNVYAARKAAEREAEEKAREDAIKAAQMDLEASKQQVTDSVAQDYIKYNNPDAKTFEQVQKEEEQKQAALNALHELDDLAKNGGINSLNNSTKDWWLAGSSSKNIGRREQALSTLVPMTAKVAHDAGISGINSVGEAMLYLGIPENATSKQIEGMLPGVMKKLGLEKDFYQMSPEKDGGLAF